YQGGITAYNAGQKTRHLQVEPIHALTCDCVSEQTAVEMAQGSNQLFLSEYAIGITGYATPQPEDGIHELFAFVAIARRQDLLRATRLLSHEKHPLDVQVDFTNQALKLFLTAIQYSAPLPSRSVRCTTSQCGVFPSPVISQPKTNSK